jgi:diadenosine tetraphosphate (Ap4A) HIT family hydrolase
MSAMRQLGLVFLTLLPLYAETGACTCNPSDPASLQARECSLTNEALRQPASLSFFTLKDASPRKPNRTLILPTRIKPDSIQTLPDLSAAERTRLWTEAIAQAKSLWGAEWGLAYNGVKVRTQCHLHIHIGKLLRGVDTGTTLLVDHPSQIPVPRDGTGLWIHPVGRRLKVHVKEQTTETVLLR